jgi:hypothetical protein
VREYNDLIERRKDCPVSVMYLKASGRLDQRHIIALLDATCLTRLVRPTKSRSDASLAWRPGIHGLASLSVIPVDACGPQRDLVMPCEAAGHPTPEKVIDASCN